MSDQYNEMLTMIQGMQRTDPRTYQAFQKVILSLRALDLQLNPLVREGSNVVIAGPVSAPTGFTWTYVPTGILFSWDIVTSAILYELREGGTMWSDSSFVLRSSSLSAVILPRLVGSYLFRLKSINSAGEESSLESVLIVTIVAPDGTTPSAAVIDNNVLLTWPISASYFMIDYYEITRNGSVFGIVRGNFTTIFESVAGSYTYGITAVDIAGNRSVENTIVATVSQPPDFVLDASFISNLIGTRVNVYVIPC